MEPMMQKFSLHLSDPDSSAKLSTSADATAASITEFIYDTDSSGTFYAWFKRWEDIFYVEITKADDAWKSNSILATFQTEFEARRKYLTVTINGKPVHLQLDPASDISLISKRTWHMIGLSPMITLDKKSMNISGGFLRLTGEPECDVSFEGTQFKETCYLTNRPKLNLIGLDWIRKLGLLELPLNRICNAVQSIWPSPAKSNQVATKLMSTLQAKFAPVFQEDLGCYNKPKVTLRIQPNAKPVFRPKRPVPYAALTVVDQELDRLQRDGRWATMLLGCDFDIRYQSTTTIGQADALSRLLNSRTEEPENTVIMSVSIESEVNSLLMDSINAFPVTFEEVRKATQQDPLLRQVIKYHRNQWSVKTSGKL
ncbi:unnamed protein product [Dibothriocephalus latus]|uniref:Uncharacterized protein n=1 Tax=Dibothriocephalus latus TaxID=60516 RepID=A0A3P7NLW8_DIBLA|nr:unnamed protein product [Dibothriocephalus latus]